MIYGKYHSSDDKWDLEIFPTPVLFLDFFPKRKVLKQYPRDYSLSVSTLAKSCGI